MLCNGKWPTIHSSPPLCCKPQNLLSVAQLTDEVGLHVLFRPKEVILLKPRLNASSQLVARAPRHGNRYIIRLRIISPLPLPHVSTHDHDRAHIQLFDNHRLRTASHQASQVPPPPAQSPLAPAPHDQPALAIRSHLHSPDTQTNATPAQPHAASGTASQNLASRSKTGVAIVPTSGSAPAAGRITRSATTIPRAKPYLPRTCAHRTTNTIPYPSHLPDIPTKSRAVIDAN